MSSQGKSHRAINADAASPKIAASGIRPPPSPEDVRAQLERILASSEFLGSQRTRRFLSYVVEETLAGRDDRIKAFSVAMAAFDRDETFNPQTDPIVRIEAGRLRRCLERYYLTEGAVAGGVHIEIPKGGYVPIFSRIEPAEHPSGTEASAPEPHSAGHSPTILRRMAPQKPTVVLSVVLVIFGLLGALVVNLARLEQLAQQEQGQVERSARLSVLPSVAVLTFQSAGDVPDKLGFASGMTNEITRELRQQSAMIVLGPRSLQRLGPTPDVTMIGQETGANFVLSGDIQYGPSKVRIGVQLTETKLGNVVWADTFERNFNASDVFDLQAEISRDVVRKVVQPQGAIALYDWKRTKGKAPESWEAYDCVVQAEDLYRRGILALHAGDATACLKRAIDEEPSYADPWIMLALMKIDFLRYKPMIEVMPDTLDTAIAAAQHGVELAPDSGRARMALMMALHFRGDIEQALAVGEVALRLSPQDPDVVGEVGSRLVLSGNAAVGLDLLQRAAELYVDVPDGIRLFIALGHLRQGALMEASDAIAGISARPNYVYCAVMAAVFGKAGKLAQAGKAADDLLRTYPDFAAWASEELARRHMAPGLAETMVEGWRAAGLDIAVLPYETRNP